MKLTSQENTIMINESDWKDNQENRFLVSQGVDKQIQEREYDESGFTNIDDIDWDTL